jgi:hypothetical protein
MKYEGKPTLNIVGMNRNGKASYVMFKHNDPRLPVVTYRTIPEDKVMDVIQPYIDLGYKVVSELDLEEISKFDGKDISQLVKDGDLSARRDGVVYTAGVVEGE